MERSGGEPYFSNPDIVVNGEAIGAEGERDNARTINNTAPVVSRWVWPKDKDQNGLCDRGEIIGDPTLDCDENWLLDSYEMAQHPELDCDENGILDRCEPEVPRGACCMSSCPSQGGQFGGGVRCLPHQLVSECERLTPCECAAFGNKGVYHEDGSRCIAIDCQSAPD